jgi:cell division protein FtsL
MTRARAQRLIHNEEVFRRANERLHDDWSRLGIEAATQALFLCECGDAACREPIRIVMSEYEAVRADPDVFLLIPGHENTAVETVVANHEGRYAVVRKNGESEA